MENGGKKTRIGQKFDHFVDECKMAVSGVVLATRKPLFWLVFGLTFVVFGTLVNLLASGFGIFSTLSSASWGEKFEIIGSAFLANFGVERSFSDWIWSFIVVFLQSILIALIVLVWQGRRRSHKEEVLRQAKNASNVQDASIAAGLALLGSGCPTCGTSLLAPIISSFVSSGSYILAGILSWLLTAAAVILLLYALKRTGKEAYVTFLAEDFHQRKRDKKGKNDSKTSGQR